MGQQYGARFRLTFRAWLYQHRHDDTAIGDVARAVIADDACLRRHDVKHVNGYLRHFADLHAATADDLKTVAVAWAAYQREEMTQR